jgi:hypothetical protein
MLISIHNYDLKSQNKETSVFMNNNDNIGGKKEGKSLVHEEYTREPN